MQKLDRKEKIVIAIGLILVIIGISLIISTGKFIGNVPIQSIFIFIFMPITIGLVLIILPIIKKKRKPKSDFKKEVRNTSLKIKDSPDNDPLSTVKSENNRKCKVCGTNISSNEKNCPGCGDIYS